MQFSSTATLNALRTQLYTVFRDRPTPPSFADRFFTEVSSTTELNTYDWLAELDGYHEWVGPRVIQALKERSYQIVNKHFEKTLAVHRNKLEDSPMTAIGDAGTRLKLLLDAADTLKDDLLFAPSSAVPGIISGLIVNGHQTLCLDGQNYFDTDHPTDMDNVTGTQSNYEVSGFALTAPNFATARARMQSFRGENGRPMRVNPSVLVVPPALGKAADEIVTATYGSSGASNVLAGKAEVVVVPQLSLISDTRWFLFDLDSPGPKPFIFQRRSARKLVQMFAETDPNVFYNNELVWGVDERAAAGYGIWQRAFSGNA